MELKKRHALLPPSLNGLRVFESAARHLSFTLAASELNVTQSAVSRQIRQLEENLGFPLFIRHHRALELTEQGKEVALLLTRQYSELNRTIKQCRVQETGTLKVKASMSFAVRWLIPRLHSFKALHPALDIVISSSMGHTSEELMLDEDDYHVAIYNMQHEPPSRYQQHFLRKEYLAPVYSGQLTRSDQPVSIDTLLNYPRLHPTSDQSDWKLWLESNHRPSQIQQPGLTFNTLDMALTSCLAGQGVAITDLMLVVHELEQDYLMLPKHAAIVANSQWKYFYHTTTESDDVTHFINWLTAEQMKEKTALLRMAEQHGWTILD